MERSERFGLALTPDEQAALYNLARLDRCSAASVVRRLVWHEAERRGALPNSSQVGKFYNKLR
jgi:hypothetical protein